MSEDKSSFSLGESKNAIVDLTDATDEAPQWLARLSPHGRSMIARVLEHFSASGVNTGTSTGARGETAAASSGRVTRQARHAKQARARTTAVAGSLLLAPADHELREFVLSAEFATLRPYNADIQTKWPYLVSSAVGLTQPACEQLFDEAAELFLTLASQVRTLPDAEVLRILNAVTALLIGPLLAGPAFRGRVDALVRDADRRGLLENKVFRIRLGFLSNWAGDDEPLQRNVLDPELKDTGTGDGYLFVRSDMRADVFSTCVELLREGEIDPERCLLRSHPEATIVQLLDFTLTRLRDTAQLRTPGYLLLMLAAVVNVRDHARELYARGVIREGLGAIQERLLRFERVQVMEKRRYQELLGSMPEGPAKERMQALWAAGFHQELG